MKKRLMLLMATLLLVLGALTLTACKTTPPEVGSECTHQWGEWTVKVAATCAEEGTEERTCALCRSTERRTIAKAAHQFGTEWVGTAEGHHHKCLNCDAVSTTEAHRAGPEATTTTSQICLDCGYIFHHAIAHKLTKAEAVAPTCLTAGNQEYWHCEDCGANFADAEAKTQLNNPVLAALGHTWDKEDPGCEDDLTCTVCHAIRLAQGHQYELTDTTELSCTTNATNTYTCSECGHSYVQVTEKAPGHDLGTWKKTGDPSRIGESCEYRQAYHADCSNEGCPGADKTETLTIHHFGVPEVTKLATCHANGEKTYTCADCGATRTEEFEDTTAHKWNNGTAAGGNIVYECTVAGCGKTKTEYNSTTASVAKKDLTDEIALKDASLSLDETVKNKLGANTTFTAEKISLGDLGSELGEGAEYLKNDALVFEFGMQSDGVAVGFGGGKVTVRIPYTLSEDDDPDNIAVFYIDNDGNLKFYTAKYVNGYAVFEADHFSTYTVTRLTPEERCKLYGHSDRDIVVAPTCEDEGYTISVCLRCRDTRKHDIKPALGHDWETFSETKDVVDCTHSKTKVSRCKICSEEVTEYTPALGHSWTETDRVEASCTAAGSVKKTCETCNASFTETIPQRAHNYKSEITEATCTTDGYTTNTCLACGYVLKNNFVSAYGHNFKETTVAATCTEGGYTLMECRNCDYSCRINETPAAHTWDRAAVDCGHAQTCVICGTVGAPATENHQMVNGVCSVCGEGCTHDFVASTVAPTCEERGYTLEKCDKCGLEKKSNYTDALGHTGVASCERCGKDLLSDEYLGKLLADNRRQKFNLCFNNFVITSPGTSSDGEKMDMTVTIKFAELIIGKDEDGNLTGSAYGHLLIVQGFEHPVLQFRAVLRGDTLYFSYEGQADEIGGSPSREYIDKITTAYGKLSIPEMLGYLSMENATPATAAPMLILNVCRKLPELIGSFTDGTTAGKDFAAIGKSARRILLGFFDVTCEGEDYVFTFSTEKLCNFLLSETVSDMLDYLFGESALAKLEQEIFKLGDSTVAELVKICNDKGIDQNDIYAKLNSAISSISGGSIKTVEEALAAAGINLGTKEDGTPVTVIDLLNQLISSEKTLFDMAVAKINESAEEGQEITVNDLKTAISSKLNEYGAANPIELILASGSGNPGSSAPNDPESGAPAPEEEKPESTPAQAVAEGIRHYLGLLGEDLHISVITGKDAKVKSIEIALEMNVSDYAEDGIGSISLSLSLPTEYAAKLDVNAFAEEAAKKTENVKLTRKTLSKFLNNPQYIFEFDEDGNCVSITYADLTPTSIGIHSLGFSQIWYIGTGNDENGTAYLLRVYKQTSYVFSGNDLSALLIEDCGTTALSNLLCYKSTTYGVYKYYGANIAPVPYTGEYDHQYDEEMTTRTVSDTLQMLINVNTGKVLSILDDRKGNEVNTLHVWVLGKTVPAVGCEGVGEEHYICTECGKTYVRYFTNGHQNTITTGEFLTDQKDCEAGVTAITRCVDCGKVLNTETIYTHDRFVLARYDVSKDALGTIGSLCGGTVEQHGCLCGKYLSVESDLECDGYYKERDGILRRDSKDFYCEVAVCAVTDPEPCGFVYGRYTEPYMDGCRRMDRKVYFFGAEFTGYDEEDRSVYRLTGKSVILYGYSWQSDHIPQNPVSSTKTVTLTINGEKQNYDIPIEICSSCKEYYGKIDKENTGIHISGKGLAYNLYATIHFDGGYCTIDEYTEEDGSLSSRVTKTVIYGTNGNQCRGTQVSERKNTAPETETFIACDFFAFTDRWVKKPTCTGRGSYYRYCQYCHYQYGELQYSDPYGHDLAYNSEKGLYVCEICGLKSKGGMKGTVVLEDLTEKNSGECKVGYWLVNDDISFTVYLSLVAEDGTELVLTEFDEFHYGGSAYQNFVSFNTRDAILAAIEEYGTDLNGTYRLKLSFVPEESGKDLDYAVTFDTVYALENSKLK